MKTRCFLSTVALCAALSPIVSAGPFDPALGAKAELGVDARLDIQSALIRFDDTRIADSFDADDEEVVVHAVYLIPDSPAAQAAQTAMAGSHAR